jgi:WD40 repeat protein
MFLLVIGFLGIAWPLRRTINTISTSAGGRKSKANLLDDLIRFQEDQNSALVSVFNGQIHSIDFANRALELKKNDHLQDSSQYGVLSPDGSEIALISQKTLNRRIFFALRTSKLDGSAAEDYSELTSPSGMCWSADNTKLALLANYTKSGQMVTALQIMKLGPREMEPVDDMNSFTTPQCWSPDGMVVVYTRNGDGGKQTVTTYDTQTKQKREIANGGRATWIPTTDWITYLDCGIELHDCTYYAIHPDGTGKKALFKTSAAVTGLSWSPDGRFGAYVSPGSTLEPWVRWRLRVRRLEDNSEDWVANLSDTDPIEFQWILSKDLTPQK